MSLTVTSGNDTLVASTRVSAQLEWNSFDFPVIVLTASPASLKLSSRADIYSWAYGGEHSQVVSADMSISQIMSDAFAFVLSSEFLGGNISYEITAPLQAPVGHDPEFGEILISGGEGKGTIRVVIESSSSVRLEIDSDGDRTVDDYLYTTWDALQSRDSSQQ